MKNAESTVGPSPRAGAGGKGGTVVGKVAVREEDEHCSARYGYPPLAQYTGERAKDIGGGAGRTGPRLAHALLQHPLLPLLA